MFTVLRKSQTLQGVRIYQAIPTICSCLEDFIATFKYARENGRSTRDLIISSSTTNTSFDIWMHTVNPGISPKCDMELVSQLPMQRKKSVKKDVSAQAPADKVGQEISTVSINDIKSPMFWLNNLPHICKADLVVIRKIIARIEFLYDNAELNLLLAQKRNLLKSIELARNLVVKFVLQPNDELITVMTSRLKDIDSQIMSIYSAQEKKRKSLAKLWSKICIKFKG